MAQDKNQAAINRVVGCIKENQDFFKLTSIPKNVGFNRWISQHPSHEKMLRDYAENFLTYLNNEKTVDTRINKNASFNAAQYFAELITQEHYIFLTEFLSKNLHISKFLFETLPKIEEIIECWREAGSPSGFEQPSPVKPRNTSRETQTKPDKLQQIPDLSENFPEEKTPTLEEKSPINDLAYAGETEKVRELLSNNPKIVNNLDSNNWTPLLCAIEGGHTSVAEVLLEYNADINAEDGTGATPIFVALSKENAELVQILLDKKASIELKDKNERTPLHHLMFTNPNNLKILGILLRHYPNYETYIQEKLINQKKGNEMEHLEVIQMISSYKQSHPSSPSVSPVKNSTETQGLKDCKNIDILFKPKGQGEKKPNENEADTPKSTLNNIFQ